MCGIAGYFGSVDPAAPARVRRMLAAQRHRGPDGAGLALRGSRASWVVSFATSPQGLAISDTDASGCVLGHNLLAIQDQTDAARQPMIRGDSALAFNGEIYNFVELRAGLQTKGVEFHSAGDTEVLLELLRREGLDCLTRLRGMFAFGAVSGNTLWLARDPFGIKPLYYAVEQGNLLFASEIRSLHAGGVARKLSPEAVVASAAAGVNVFGEGKTLYEGILELPPGHLLTASAEGTRIRRYADLPPLRCDLSGDEANAVLRAAADESIRLHLRSRRRIATCLSGGLDSSNIAAMVGHQLGEARGEFQTFTIRTAGPEDSELEMASEVARGAGLRHVLVEPPEISASDVLEMTVAYEVPNHVIGPINQFLLLREIAASGTTVVLDGQGGDELLSGYPWYAPVLLREIARRGRDAAAMEAKLRANLPLDPATMQSFERMFHDPAAWVEAFVWQGHFLGWSREQIGELSPTRYYLQGGGDWRTFRRRQYLQGELQYLLRQEDRLGMWFGLECRVPFVDVPLVSVAARLSPEWLIHDGFLKYPFRVMLPDLPESVRWNTRKRGFWETDRSRFPWVNQVGKQLAADSMTLRELFPTVLADWDTLSFDQHWRLLQLAVLERCGDADSLHDLRRDLRVA
ncbi:MAG TPA: asparagine synthase (glutamine-hydrolyzing) [Tepidisphaeraceae bacterium]|nr:asparagine synthase (glutamine-hydrolyzing) [Tepidisphaeraceae bacterium]